MGSILIYLKIVRKTKKKKKQSVVEKIERK